MFKAIESAKKYSEKTVRQISKELSQIIDNKSFCIVTTGSFARNEASKESDLDSFIITKEDIIPGYIEQNNELHTTKDFQKQMQKIIEKHIKKDLVVQEHLDLML